MMIKRVILLAARQDLPGFKMVYQTLLPLPSDMQIFAIGGEAVE